MEHNLPVTERWPEVSPARERTGGPGASGERLSRDDEHAAMGSTPLRERRVSHPRGGCRRHIDRPWTQASPALHLPQLLLQLADLVAQAGRELEVQLGGRLVHLRRQLLDEVREVGRGHVGRALGRATRGRPRRRPPSRRARSRPCPGTASARSRCSSSVSASSRCEQVGDVGDLLAQRLSGRCRARCCRRPASRGAGWSRRSPAAIDGVILSAYMCTWPDTLRAARPMVWMSDRAERRKPSLSASRIDTSDTSGRSRPSRSRLMPTRTSNSPMPQLAQQLDAPQGVDLAVQVADPDALVEQVVGEVLGHLLGQRRDEDPLVALRRARWISCDAGRRSGPWSA